MLTPDEIPAWNDKSEAGMFAWWKTMVIHGLAHHPDDDPSDIVGIETGKRCFTDRACNKLRGIYSEMASLHGDVIYEAGQTALMNSCGREWSPVLSGWVEKARA